MLHDLRTLISSFSGADRGRLLASAAGSFVVACLDLLGVAMVLPLMQVVMGDGLNEGAVGTMYRALGEPSKQDFVVMLGAMMVLAFVLKAALSLAFTWWSSGLVTRLQADTSKRTLQAFLNESYLEHRQRNTGELMRNVGSATADAHFRVLGGILDALSSILSLVLLTTLLLAVAPLQTFVAAAYFGAIVYALQRFMGPANRRAGTEAQHTAWVSSHALVDAMQGFREGVLHNARGYFVDKYDSANRRQAEATRRANYLSAVPKYALELVTMIGLSLLLVSTTLTGSTSDTMPTMSLFVAAVVRMLPLMVALTATLGLIRVGREGLSITAETIRRLPDLESPTHSPRLPAVTGTVEAHDLAFRYLDASSNVIDQVSFSIPPGGSLALCGPSGSGKTTLVNLILGLLRPTSGQLTYAGIPTTEAGDGWYDIVAFVPQDVYLSDDTLTANIAFGVPPDIRDHHRIQEAIDQAALTDVVASLPEGLDTLVGERGTRLSGGQRQRVGIARALYRCPKILVLDEATSALDNETEHRITRTIQNLHGSITTIVVAHRLSTVRHVDTIAFMESGRITASGPFDTVVHDSPTFAELVRLGDLGSDVQAIEEIRE